MGASYFIDEETLTHSTDMECPDSVQGAWNTCGVIGVTPDPGAPLQKPTVQQERWKSVK